jgi:hypothetical protein
VNIHRALLELSETLSVFQRFHASMCCRLARPLLGASESLTLGGSERGTEWYKEAGASFPQQVAKAL